MASLICPHPVGERFHHRPGPTLGDGPSGTGEVGGVWHDGSTTTFGVHSKSVAARAGPSVTTVHRELSHGRQNATQKRPLALIQRAQTHQQESLLYFGNRWRQLQLSRHTGYWKPGLPRRDRLSVRILPDPSALLVNLESGAVDVAYPVPLNEVGRIQSGARTTVALNPMAGNQAYLVRVDEAPFTDKRVRQVLYLAVDR